VDGSALGRAGVQRSKRSGEVPVGLSLLQGTTQALATHAACHFDLDDDSAPAKDSMVTAAFLS
jgi:hypothetical protein